jgi:adenosylcobinamide kinase/adenosylcobinamide-phosphate guanylyltransferase
MVSPLVAPSSLLVLGGVRSGKSRFALTAHPAGRRVAFVATARPDDPDMAGRIARHRAERPPGWHTVEEPLALVERIGELAERGHGIVVDCLTLWVANRMEHGDTDTDILAATAALAALLAGRRHDVTLVSNEVGAGVHPPTAAGLRFCDLLGQVNQRVAAAADRVVLMVAGLPVTIKAPGPVDDVARPAP